MKIDFVLIKPVLTEKATDLTKQSWYAFEIHEHASKTQAKAAIEQMFKVKVGQVRVVVRKGKIRRVGRKMVTKQMPTRKIAYVKLKEGKIDLFPQA